MLRWYEDLAGVSLFASILSSALFHISNSITAQIKLNSIVHGKRNGLASLRSDFSIPSSSSRVSPSWSISCWVSSTNALSNKRNAWGMRVKNSRPRTRITRPVRGEQTGKRNVWNGTLSFLVLARFGQTILTVGWERRGERENTRKRFYEYGNEQRVWPISGVTRC